MNDYKPLAAPPSGATVYKLRPGLEVVPARSISLEFSILGCSTEINSYDGQKATDILQGQAGAPLAVFGQAPRLMTAAVDASHLSTGRP